MDPISTAIIAALGKLAEPAVRDAYDALKNLLVRKLGKKSEVMTAVEQLEQKPESAGRSATLQEEMAGAKAGSDVEILQHAQTLLEKIQAQPGGSQTIRQTVTGDGNILSGSGDVTVQLGASERPRRT